MHNQWLAVMLSTSHSTLSNESRVTQLNIATQKESKKPRNINPSWQTTESISVIYILCVTSSCFMNCILLTIVRAVFLHHHSFEDFISQLSSNTPTKVPECWSYYFLHPRGSNVFGKRSNCITTFSMIDNDEPDKDSQLNRM
jgi:hypothetical protein